MKKTPWGKTYHGRLINVRTTLPSLIRYPAGSCCLYLVDSPFYFQSTAASMAMRAGGKVVTESLLGLDLSTEELFDIVRVIVVKPSKAPDNFKPATQNFCAPPFTLSRCKVGTACVYEDIVKRKYLHDAFKNAGARGSIAKCHLIDIRRGITKPIYYCEVTKTGRPYEHEPNDFHYYQAFM